MAVIDVFNGDADGLCALVQLRLQHPAQSELVTGVKRDIRLLDRIVARKGDRLTVLDISLDSNRADLQRLLDAGAIVEYFDHHYADPIPEHPCLDAYIDTASDTCTSILVDRNLGGAQRLWAITGAFGDNLHQAAEQLADTVGLTSVKTCLLRELGEALNYNAYGEAVTDLRYPPGALFSVLLQASNPFTFIHDFPHSRILRQGLDEDIGKARCIHPVSRTSLGAIYMLPDVDWARRVSGAFANELSAANPSMAHAILTCNVIDKGYTVSVRAPKANPTGADQLCRLFPTGGGRKAAAGINSLLETQLPVFVDAFHQQYG